MATGNAAMPFSFAAKANKADNKLVIFSKTNRPLPPPSLLQDAALKERNNSSFIIYRTRTLERVTPYCCTLYHSSVCVCRRRRLLRRRLSPSARADVLSQRSDAVSKGAHASLQMSSSIIAAPRRTHPLYLLELKLNKRLLLRCCAVLYLS